VWIKRQPHGEGAKSNNMTVGTSSTNDTLAGTHAIIGSSDFAPKLHKYKDLTEFILAYVGPASGILRFRGPEAQS
jgi:hypothetical protein